MTSDPPGAGPGLPADAEELTFRTPQGDTVRSKVIPGPDESMAPAHLAARAVQLADGTELRQLRVAGSHRKPGYDRIDNEILAGLRLREMTETVGYPSEVSRLYGYEATSADPFALVEPYRGEPLSVVGQHLLPAEQHQFQVSLLTGLCWLAAAGIAHRGIEPATVRWHGGNVQITEFSLSTMIGAPRGPIGTLPWAAPEQRPGNASGLVGIRDDIWAAGRLIFYVHTQEELIYRQQLADWPALEVLLDDVFGPPDRRPTARDLLGRLNAECPVPQSLNSHSQLDDGRRHFYAVRQAKHPGTATFAAGGSPGPAGGPSSPETAASGAGSQGSGTPGQARTTRRLLRRFPLLMGLLSGALSAMIVTSPVR